LKIGQDMSDLQPWVWSCVLFWDSVY